MSYSERAYFESDHCAHCAAHDESERMRQIARVARDVRRTWNDRRGRAR